METFSHRGLIESNLEAIWRKRVENENKDLTILICGAPGNGKSALTWLAGEWMAGNINPIGFDWKTVAFTHNQWIDNEQDKLDKYTVSWYDEGYNTFYARNAMTNENKEGKSHLNQYRFKHHTRFINFQDILNIEKDLLYSNEIGVDGILRCVKQGWVWGFSAAKANKIDIRKKGDKKEVNWPEPDFKDGFPDPAKKWPEKWREYEEVNARKVKEGEEGYTPDDDDDGLSIKEMAKLIIKQGADPEHSDFVSKYNGRAYVDKDLVATEFELSHRVAKQVKKYADKKLGIG